MFDWQNLIDQQLQDRELPELPARIQFPRPPHSVLHFMQLVDRPDTPMDELAEIIEHDTEIATNVLRLVNGSLTMLREKISSISRAIKLLGLKRCKMLVMSAAIHAAMSNDKCPRKQISDLLSESQIRALYARRVAELLKVDPEVTYVSALLQDLLLPQLMGADAKLYDTYNPVKGRLVDYEAQKLNFTHSHLTAALLAEWNFAPEIVACVLMHHDHQTILNDHTLWKTELTPVAISSLLPGPFTQEPDGVNKLMEFQRTIPQFDFLQIATDIDEILLSPNSGVRHHHLLAERLGRLACAAIESRSSKIDWIERSLGAYTLEEQIGQGGMGVVYRARHSMLRRPAAVKMLKASQLSPKALERFEAEAHITSELTSPHTVQIYDYGMSLEGVLYYVMEYLEGVSLAELVSQTGPICEERIIHFICQICGSLAEAHSSGLIHRDIKPENIAVTVCAGAYDFVKVLDFGLVAVKDEIPALADTDKLFGTPAYMSPESIKLPDSVDERTDIYALGAVAYFLLAGKPLFADLDLMDLLKAQVSEVPVIPEGVCSCEFTEIIARCLSKDPGERPQSVMELAALLGDCKLANAWTFERAADWWSRNEVKRARHKNPSQFSATRVAGPHELRGDTRGYVLDRQSKSIDVDKQDRKTWNVATEQFVES